MKTIIFVIFVLLIDSVCLLVTSNYNHIIITKQQQIIDSLKVENTNWEELYKLSE